MLYKKTRLSKEIETGQASNSGTFSPNIRRNSPAFTCSRPFEQHLVNQQSWFPYIPQNTITEKIFEHSAVDPQVIYNYNSLAQPVLIYSMPPVFTSASTWMNPSIYSQGTMFQRVQSNPIVSHLLQPAEYLLSLGKTSKNAERQLNIGQSLCTPHKMNQEKCDGDFLQI